MQPVTVTLHNNIPITLRLATPDDAGDLVVIQQQVFEESISNVDDVVDSEDERRNELATLPRGTLWLVADFEGQVIGSLEMHRMRPSFMQHHVMLGIEIHRDWRGVGLGGAMIRQGIRWARANGVEMIRLGVLDSNPRAKALYERLGFRAIGHFPNFVKRRDGSYSGDTEMILEL